MDWRGEIEAAAGRIAGHVRETPVIGLRGFGLAQPVEFQHTGSFKARGAFNTLLAAPVPAAGLVAGLVAASGGNHGAAVGYAAARLGHKAAVFVPEMAGPAKIALIERTGADLRVIPGAYAEALAEAQTYEAETGAGQVHAYDAVPTVAGQGTLMREWEAQELGGDDRDDRGVRSSAGAEGLQRQHSPGLRGPAYQPGPGGAAGEGPHDLD